ncbi:MAG: hypothetical protein ACTHMP_11320 [Thermomicrobiales bacterium]
MSQDYERNRADDGDDLIRENLTRTDEMRDTAMGNAASARDTVVHTGPVSAVRQDVVAPPMREAALPVAYTHGQIFWGSVWAGFFVAFFIFLVAEFLGLAIGMSVTGKSPSGFRLAAEVWTAVFAFIAYLVGGFVSGASAATTDRNWGAVNGFMVFLLTVPIALLLSGLGLGAVFGIAGATVGTTTGTTTTQMAATDASAAWTIFVILCVGFIASGIGGAAGTRRALAANRLAGRVAAS